MVARVSFLPTKYDKKHLSFFQSSLERNKHLSFSRKDGVYIDILQYDSAITICRIQPYAAVDVFFSNPSSILSKNHNILERNTSKI